MPREIVWSRDLVNRFWDGVSQTRLTELSFSRTVGAKLVDYLSEYLEPGVRCLDFGAGDGSLVRLLVDRGCYAAAYEPSSERCSQIVDPKLKGNPGFLGIANPEHEQTFDIVIAAEVMEHVLDDEMETVLKTIRRYLKPGGVLIVTTPNDEDLGLGACYCPISDTVFHRWQHLRTFTAESLNTLLARAGFTRLADHRVDFSAYGELHERYRQLEHDARYMSLLGPLYRLVKRFFQKPSSGELRLGAQTHLIYVGRAG